jgi:3-hydroxyacyl-[acyl-carrier-protein] dehydratase
MLAEQQHPKRAGVAPAAAARARSALFVPLRRILTVPFICCCYGHIQQCVIWFLHLNGSCLNRPPSQTQRTTHHPNQHQTQTQTNSYPFLLVDRVVEVEPQKYAVGYKNVTANDQFFNGHFPERAIMPGVLQIEAMAQLGGIAMLDPNDTAAKNQFFFGGIEGCRFRKPVVPGDTLMMRVEVSKFNKRFGIVKMDAKGYVGDELAVEAELTLAMGKASSA